MPPSFNLIQQQGLTLYITTQVRVLIRPKSQNPKATKKSYKIMLVYFREIRF